MTMTSTPPPVFCRVGFCRCGKEVWAVYHPNGGNYTDYVHGDLTSVCRHPDGTPRVVYVEEMEEK